MPEILANHIRKFIAINDDALEAVLSFFQPFHLRKKEIILRQGEKCQQLFFVCSGCMHAFYTDDDGADKSIQFGLENWWITDFQAFYRRRITDSTYQAIEPTDLMVITTDQYEKLLQDYPVMERYFRIIFEIGYGAVINRLKYIFTASKEEVFYRFREQYPDFVNRVPQYILATYLGLTPEYVSKLRAKKLS